jgi:hypothetical protein
MKKNLLSFILCCGFFLLFSKPAGVYAQVFKFELQNPGSVTLNTSTQVNILINTAGQQAINGDALFTFDPNTASIDSAKTGNFFSYFSATPLGGSTTKYLISSWEESVAHAKSTTTDAVFAQVFVTLKQSCATLTFECTNGTESDSNINRASDSKDIIVCPLTPLTICASASSSPTVSPTGGTSTGTPVPTDTPAASAATNTPVPTYTPVPTNTPMATATPVPSNTPRPTISELPRSGTTEITFLGIGVGALFLIAGFMLVGL